MKKEFSKTHSFCLGFPQMETGFIIGMIKMLRTSNYKVKVNGSLTGIEFDCALEILIINPPQEGNEKIEDLPFYSVISLLNKNFNNDNGYDKNGDFKIFIAYFSSENEIFDYGKRSLLMNPTYFTQHE